MFHELDTTLQNLFASAPKPVGEAAISFRTPDRSFPPQDQGQLFLNLYLYETRENRELREVAPVITRKDGRFSRQRPPLRVDCEYMVTAWSMQGSEQIEKEHQLLGAALQWISRFPEIPERFLSNALQNAPFAHPTLSAQMDGTGNIGEFWSSMGTPPRPSFDLVVTIALPRDELEEGPLVITKEMRMRILGKPDTEEIWFQIGGEVFNRLSVGRPPVANANVNLLGGSRNMSETTDGQGRFSFTNLASGDYVLEVTRTGFVDATKNITVPVPVPIGGAAAENYDVGLIPV